ncbi:hypothetical protein [Mycobacterium sp. URHB0044]|uniref:hypothetical protein n=1 Tax=Mycobacterium sp. URHB0044 TaxID=1380386 RepID=UPI00048B65FA|nr:hypothetical protein [Mycobacterium sp. URHB0044]
MSELNVNPEDLHVSASTVDMHADDMWTNHGLADGRLEEAQGGLPAGAVVALGAAVSKWQADSVHLFRGLVGHSDRLRTAAGEYTCTDEHGSTEIAKAGEQIIDLGL